MIRQKVESQLALWRYSYGVQHEEHICHAMIRDMHVAFLQNLDLECIMIRQMGSHGHSISSV